MKMKRLALASLGMVMALGVSKVAVGEADISYTTGATPEAVQANVKFKVVVPKVMILRVGDWGATANEVSWAYTFGLSGITPGTLGDGTEAQWDLANGAAGVDADADTEANGDKANPGTLNVWAFSNAGDDVTITAETVTAFARTNAGTTTIDAGANQPQLSDITVTTGGVIAHPASGSDNFADAASGTTVATIADTNGIVSLKDTWKYTYTPPANTPPVAGTYDAEVKYTMASI